MVKILYYGIVRQHTRCKEESIETKTLGDLLAYLEQQYGKTTLKAARASMITLNGERLETLDRKLALADGSTVGIHPICSGGSSTY
jgi:molybdopterin converting factor small subunit